MYVQDKLCPISERQHADLQLIYQVFSIHG